LAGTTPHFIEYFRPILFQICFIFTFELSIADTMKRKFESEDELSEPEALSYGQPPPPKRQLSPLDPSSELSLTMDRFESFSVSSISMKMIKSYLKNSTSLKIRSRMPMR
jgi:hypothetical protein